MPFKKGNNANPNGRPKKEWTWAGLVQKAMEKQITQPDGKKYAKKEYLADVLVQKALTGDIQAIKEIGDRVDGRPKQQTDITSNGETLQGLIEIK